MPDPDANTQESGASQLHTRSTSLARSLCLSLSLCLSTIPKEFTEFIKSNQNKILFKASSSALDKGGRATLEKVKMLLNTYQNTAIIIEGHTSTDGSASYNQKLSEQRASAIKDYLISQTIDASRISTIGYGENQPIGDNKTVKGFWVTLIL